MPTSPPLPRRLLAEFLGSAFLAALVIGSGIAARQLSPNDIGLSCSRTRPRPPLACSRSSWAAVSISTHHRASLAHLLSEVIATSGLIFVIFALARTRRASTAPAAVGAYIGAAYFTSSASFANPAITIGPSWTLITRRS